MYAYQHVITKDFNVDERHKRENDIHDYNFSF